MYTLDELQGRCREFVWTQQPGRPRWQRVLSHLARLGLVITRDLASGALTLRAMSLVFTSLLAFVPLIAVSFSVLKGFGVHNRIEPVLYRLLAPLGERADEITERIIGFVDNVKVGVLGAVGIALLFYTAISLVQKVEGAFNYTWNIDRRRTLVRRFSDYLSVLVIGPVLVFGALGMTATLTNSSVAHSLASVQPFGVLLRLLAAFAPYLLVIGAFTFIYVLIPNTRVRLRPALIGGVIAGVVWETVGRVFAVFVATSTNYTAIYSSFAILLLFMLWLYLSWLILLIGSAIAFYEQRPEYLQVGGRDHSRLSIAQTERLALALMGLVASDWYRSEPPPARDQLARRLHVPLELIDETLTRLLDGGLLAPTGPEPAGYLPATPPEKTGIDRVLATIRSHGALDHVLVAQGSPDARVAARFEAALTESMAPWTVADLAGGADEPGQCEPVESIETPS